MTRQIRKPAFIVSSLMMTSTPASSSSHNRQVVTKGKENSFAAASAGRKSLKKRARPSELTRKYRQVMPEFDEALLIGDATAGLIHGQNGMLISDSDAANETNAPTPPGTATKQKRKISAKSSRVHQALDENTTLCHRSTVPDIYRAKLDDSSTSTVTAVSLSKKRSTLSNRKHKKRGTKEIISHSRFPRTWNDALEHAANAVLSAFSNRHDRLRVDIQHPEMLKNAPEYTASSRGHEQLLRKAWYLAHVVVRLIDKLMQAHNSQKPLLAKEDFSPCGILVMFNSQCEAEVGASVVTACKEVSNMQVRVGILGQVDAGEFSSNLIFIVAPCNRQGNPAQIEAVEMVHYSNFNQSNWLIILNPDLIALTKFPSFSDEPRQPVLLSDYLLTYHLNPLSFPSKVATGALLRCFPRKWELYLQMMDDPTGFRLISEQAVRPSWQRIASEFSHRIDKG